MPLGVSTLSAHGSGQHDKNDAPVWLSRLKLSDFRIHQKIDLSLPSPAPVVLTGANGAGKTSLLEAISLFGPGHGLRTARHEKLMREADHPSGWSVAVKMFHQSTLYHVGTGCVFDAAGLSRRRVRMNGRDISAAHLARYIRLFWLTPSMARLFGEGSHRSARRRLIDRITMGLFPDHAAHLTGFDRARRARHSILAENRRADEWLTALEAQMAEHGCALAAARAEAAQKINAHMSRLKPETFPDGHISIIGRFEEEFCQKNSKEENSKEENVLRYRAELARLRGRSGHYERYGDAAAHRLGLGPHHADIVLTHRPSGLSADHCSAGEVKALLTGLVLASARLACEYSAAQAVILLDDIAAHLDETRRYGLFEALADFPAQIWMTGTDRDIFAPLRMDAHFFAIAPSSAQPA